MSHDPTANPPGEQQSLTRNGQSSGILPPFTSAETQQPPAVVDRPVSQSYDIADAPLPLSGVLTLAPETTPSHSSLEGRRAIGTKDVRGSAAADLVAALGIAYDVAQLVADKPNVQSVIRFVKVCSNTCQFLSS